MNSTYQTLRNSEVHRQMSSNTKTANTSTTASDTVSMDYQKSGETNRLKVDQAIPKGSVKELVKRFEAFKENVQDEAKKTIHSKVPMKITKENKEAPATSENEVSVTRRISFYEDSPIKPFVKSETTPCSLLNTVEVRGDVPLTADYSSCTLPSTASLEYLNQLHRIVENRHNEKVAELERMSQIKPRETPVEPIEESNCTLPSTMPEALKKRLNEIHNRQLNQSQKPEEEQIKLTESNIPHEATVIENEPEETPIAHEASTYEPDSLTCLSREPSVPYEEDNTSIISHGYNSSENHIEIDLTEPVAAFTVAPKSVNSKTVVVETIAAEIVSAVSEDCYPESSTTELRIGNLVVSKPIIKRYILTGHVTPVPLSPGRILAKTLPTAPLQPSRSNVYSDPSDVVHSPIANLPKSRSGKTHKLIPIDPQNKKPVSFFRRVWNFLMCGVQANDFVH